MITPETTPDWLDVFRADFWDLPSHEARLWQRELEHAFPGVGNKEIVAAVRYVAAVFGLEPKSAKLRHLRAAIQGYRDKYGSPGDKQEACALCIGGQINLPIREANKDEKCDFRWHGVPYCITIEQGANGMGVWCKCSTAQKLMSEAEKERYSHDPMKRLQRLAMEAASRRLKTSEVTSHGLSCLHNARL